MGGVWKYGYYMPEEVGHASSVRHQNVAYPHVYCTKHMGVAGIQ